MKQTFTTTRRRTPLLAAALVFASLLGMWQATPANATPLDYNVTISEDPNLVAEPTSMMAMMMASWKTQHAITTERTMPYIEIDVGNNVGSAQLTSFSINIPSLNSAHTKFDFSKFIASSPGVTLVSSNLASLPNGTTTSMLNLTFSGLGAGDFVRFQVGLYSDQTLFPDYRQTLFPLVVDTSGANFAAKFNNLANVNNASTLNATFTNGGNTTTVTDFWADPASQTSASGIPYQSNYSNMPTFTSLQMLPTHGSDHPVAFQQSFSGSTALPEPSSLVLAGMGGLGLLLQITRRKRQNKSQLVLAA